MARTSLQELSKKMKKLDLCMMTTITSRGMAASRPMSNNRDVEYDGTSYFFTEAKSHVVKDLEKNKHVNLSFTGNKSFLPKGAQIWVSVAGTAKLVKNRAKMEAHWNPDLEKWFKDGLDTPGIVMIEVKARRIKFWEREKEGEVVLKH